MFGQDVQSIGEHIKYLLIGIAHKLSSKKGAGPDMKGSMVWKHAAPCLAEELLCVLQRCCADGCTPVGWQG
eukprot:12905889-Prorocentrum_lima.AAC.1